MNKCVYCGEEFTNWVEYQEHESLSHWNREIPSQSPFAEAVETIPAFQVVASGRLDLARRTYPGPMDATEKQARDIKALEAALSRLQD